MTDLMPAEAPQTEGRSAALVAAEQSEIQSALIVARRFPRVENDAWLKLEKSCARASFADGALYSFKRAGTTIDGPSVKLAREAARVWGNIRYGVRVLPSEGKDIHLQGWALDLETNTRTEAEDRFLPLIQRKKWSDEEQAKVLQWIEPDERDLRELMSRRGAYLVRNCILQLLPPDLVDDAQGWCNQTIAAGADEGDRDKLLRSLLKRFRDHLGVSREMIETYLGHELELVDNDEFAGLKKIYVAIDDGQATRDEYFEFKKKKAAKKADPETPAEESPDGDKA